MVTKSISLFLAIIAIFVALTGCLGSSAYNPKSGYSSPIELNVSAAASLTDVLKEINAIYTRTRPNITITTNFASSGTLQAQIQNGAPVDIFISAAPVQMDNLQTRELILADTRQDLLKNKLVLIVSSNSKAGLASFQDLASEKVEKVAMGDPKSVPAGAYGQQVFDGLGIMTRIQPKLIVAGDVRQVLSYVESGNVNAGIVFMTDARTSTRVKVAAVAPDNINATIVYPVAVIKSSRNIEAAKDYENFLFSEQAKAAFEKYGFVID